jgi:hypothetical protein
MRTAQFAHLLAGLAALATSSCSAEDGGGGPSSSNLPAFGGPSATQNNSRGGSGATNTSTGPSTSSPETPGNPNLNNSGSTNTGSTGQGGAGSVPTGAAGAPNTPAAAAGSFFSNGGWQGPVVTQTSINGTTVTPANFDARVANDPFCVSGAVAQDAMYRGESRLVFGLNQPQGAAPTAIAPQGNGLAITFTRSTGSLLRIVLQAPASDTTAPPGGWCYAIPEVRGQVFVPYDQFRGACYFDNASAQSGNVPGPFYAKQPIEAVAFIVPGQDALPVEYNYCIAGITDAAGVEQAPPVPVNNFPLGDVSGNLVQSFSRAVVLGADNNKYVVQSNAWGSIQANSQKLSYRNNSFTVTQAPVRSGGSTDEPLGFPSIFVGGNGETDGNGAVSTRLTDKLPIQISSIARVQTEFAHNATNQDANATYDVWFSTNPPAGHYETATAAFLMVWTYKPNRNAIGTRVGTVTVDNRQWDLFAGPRGSGQGANGADANSPVISYIATTTIPDYNFDLNLFIQDAVQRSTANALNGQRFTANLYLTDVFAGFEIWNGGQNLSVSKFTVDVQSR